MRVLVVGVVPPAGGDSSRPLGKAVVELLDGGHEVEIWSPDGRSVAHRHVALEGLTLAVELARASRRFDALVLGLDTRLPLAHDAGRLPRAWQLGALAMALKLWKAVTIRPVSPVPVPGGLGGRPALAVWQRAERIVVGSEKDRDDLLAVPGIDPDRVRCELPPKAKAESWSEGWSLGAAPTREAVLTVVRERADRDRVLSGAEPPWYLSQGGAPVLRSRPTPSAVARVAARRGRRLASAAARRVGVG